MFNRFIIPSIIAILFLGCTQPEKSNSTWQLLGFVKTDSINPVLNPDSSSLFTDPITNKFVKWEGKDVFNNDTLFMIYRAEDFAGKYNGTSRLGIAHSTDGLHFQKAPQPIFYPENDSLKKWEWEGGAEDPRVVENEQGTYFMTYTAYDGNIARLLIASSHDLKTWTKLGSIFRDPADQNQWSKSGAIVADVKKSKLVAKKIKGNYWMYFGDTL